MHRETHTWFSSHLQQEMSLNVYGHWGGAVHRLPLFPGGATSTTKAWA